MVVQKLHLIMEFLHGLTNISNFLKWVEYKGLCNSCNMGMRDFPDMRIPKACGSKAYILGKSRASMLQVICITSSTLKIAQIYSWLLCLIIIAMGSCCEYGIFILTIS